MVSAPLKPNCRLATETGLGVDLSPQKVARVAAEQREGIPKAFFTEDDCNIEEFKALTSRRTDPRMLRFASSVDKNIPIYNCTTLKDVLDDRQTRSDLMSEWIWVLLNGPGVLVLQQAFTDLTAIDDATRVFQEIIAEEKQKGGGADHFAAKGTNDRIWNAQQKLCLKDPDLFARYWKNSFVDAVNEAYLGPGYQMTTQVNVVRPGGKSQSPHRDYHLGFQTVSEASKYPVHAHRNLSPQLTLQGAVAHVDMPIESGTTYLLPFSQLYPQGYLAWRRPEFKDHFSANYVQVPCSKGDCLFFNPALFHAGGENTTSNVQRMVNLMQASSAFGRSMENLDRARMSKALYPILSQTFATDLHGARLAVAMCAEGYSFPSNLDSDPPEDSMAPITQQALFMKALRAGWASETFNDAIDAQKLRQAP